MLQNLVYPGGTVEYLIFPVDFMSFISLRFDITRVVPQPSVYGGVLCEGELGTITETACVRVFWCNDLGSRRSTYV